MVATPAALAPLRRGHDDGVGRLASPMTHPPIPRRHPIDIVALLPLLGDIPVEREPVIVRRRSRDFFWYSPVLAEQLKSVSADIIVKPRDEADVIRTAAACARLRIPLTVRAGGTGNYGQAMPLAGGVLLDMTDITGVIWQKPGSGALVRHRFRRHPG